ncbi:MAG TPA: amylo-alpha-1,6-glucosidase [Polyangiaceae bacterium]|jgi:predicted glycogen debranching enzyme
MLLIDTDSEWLEADGLGGFASGTSAGIATRRYHALLLVAEHPPCSRFVLVNGFSAWLETASGRVQLTRHHFAPGVTTEAGAMVASFELEPWPTWRYTARGELSVVQEIFAARGSPSVIVSFRLETAHPDVTLCVRPFLSGRDFHQLHHENPAFHGEPERDGDRLHFSVYPGVPRITMRSNAAYAHAPDWYRRFRYEREAERGLDCEEDLASPGVLSFDLSQGEALWLLESVSHELTSDSEDLAAHVAECRKRERTRRASIETPLQRSAESYLVRRGTGMTLIAGYPWFGDWGRDTFIALRGLCLATGRLTDAREILVEWSRVVSDGMLPNLFPDGNGAPEYNSVDASLWYVLAAHELLNHSQSKQVLANSDRQALEGAILDIVRGYARGTRFGIRRADDGLLAAGAPGVQLTWMDAKIGDHVVTPRSGKPVEIQALWLNALSSAAHLDAQYWPWVDQARLSFERRFWNEADGMLYDVVDVDHEPGRVDATLRPNQIFAAGGLPVSLLSAERARRVVDVVEQKLWTPLGLRSLSPDDPAYRGRYQGGVWERDTAYHQGTVWPWLMGPFVEAWLKARGSTSDAKREARERFATPLLEHLERAGLGHISEIADGDAPHTPRGCPFQAWSVSELLRVVQLLSA